MRKLFSVVLIAMLLLSALPSTTNVIAQTPDPNSSVVSIDAAVMEEMETKGVSSYWVEFESSVSTLNTTNSIQDMNWSEQGWYVYETLSAEAKESQAEMIKYLTAAKIPFKSFWIKNTILVEGSDLNTLNQITKYPGVTRIESRHDYFLDMPEKVYPEKSSSVLLANSIQAVETNLTQVNADDVWGLGITGAGVVVANIDTGVRYTHEALVNQYRGNQGDGTFDHDYNWYDPYFDHAVPADDNDHGTHTMGTMVGDDGDANQIGMAPNAQWMACRGCNTSDCTDEALLSCGQFIAAPTTVEGTDANPDMRPNIVNNSWGGCGDEHDSWYDDVIDVWHSVGIYPVFSNGNASNCYYDPYPGLNTVGDPARNGSVTGVGSSGNSDGLLASHSNWGPTDDLDTVNAFPGYEDLKPQVVAPGVNIRSSTPGSDTEYQGGWSGTSMSAPHVSGLIALMWQAAPCLIGDYATTETFIEQTANPIDYDDGTTGVAHSPNYATGWGEIDALAAVQAVTGYCTLGTLSGAITDAVTGDPIENTRVILVAEGISGNNRIQYTNETGEYLINTAVDTYDIEVFKEGYELFTIDDFVVTDDSALTQNIALNPLQLGTVTGVVSDGGLLGLGAHGYPLYAELTFTARGQSTTVTTDPFDGTYSVDLYRTLDYQVKISSLILEGYKDYNGTYTPVNASEIQNYQLKPKGSCFAPGYDFVETGSFTEDFESGSLPTGWENYDYAGNGQVWEFDDPGERGNLTPNGSGSFAILDSDAYGIGGEQNAGLRTPALDFTDVVGVILNFESYYRSWSGSSGFVRVSTDDAATWTTVWTRNTTATESVSIDLSDYAGEVSVIIEFLYQGDWAYYWEIDDVLISTGDCEFVPGGLVAGYVTDANTGDTLVDAVVSSADVEVQTMDLADYPGLYLAFQPTTADPEDVEFTASMVNYSDNTGIVSVVSNEINHLNFSLEAGHLIFTPSPLNQTMALGDSPITQTWTITNDGSADATFKIIEKINLGATPLSIPAFTGTLAENKTPDSMGRAPQSFTKTSTASETFSSLFSGEPALAVDLLDEMLVNIPETTAPGTWNEVGSVSDGLYSGDFTGGDFSTLYVIDDDDNVLYAIDTTTTAAVAIGTTLPPSGQTFSGLSGTPTGELFGLTTSCSATNLVMVDPETGTTTDLGALPGIGCGIDLAYNTDDDMIYIVDVTSNNLFKVDPDTLIITEIGALGIDVKYAQGLDYEEGSGILYWAAYSEDGVGELRVIDTTTGASASVGAFPNGAEVDCLAFMTAVLDVPWLSEDIPSGTIAAGSSIDITVTFDPSSLTKTGDYEAELKIRDNTPYAYHNVAKLHLIDSNGFRIFLPLVLK